MAYYHTSKSLAICIITAFMAYYNIHSSSTLVFGENLAAASTISAAPTLLPDPISPSSSSSSSSRPPALSPDIYPVFPSPSGPQLAPSDSSAPLIPSSPSPPNPDEYVGPGDTLSPLGMLPDSSSPGRRVERLLLCSMVMLVAAFWIN